MKFSQFWLFLLLWIIPAVLLGQTKASSESITVDLGSGTFISAKGLPFDVPFTIEGPVTQNLKQITLRYRVKKGEIRKWMQFPNKPTDSSGVRIMGFSDVAKWNQIDEFKSDQKFHLQVGPLHPNVSYEFQFNLIRSVQISAEQNTSLKKKLLEALQNYAMNLRESDPGLQDAMNKKLNLILQQSVTPGARILELDMKPFKLDVNKEPLAAIMAKVMEQNIILTKFDSNLAGNYNVFTTPEYKDFLKRLAEIKPDELSAESASKWNDLLAPSVNRYKDVKVKDIAKLLCHPGTDITNLFIGTEKIEGSKILPSTEFDLPSIELLNSFFYELQLLKLEDDSTPVFEDLSKLEDINLRLEQTKTDYEEVADAFKERSGLLASFPNVLEDKLLSLSFVFFDRSNMDVVSDANPYVGLDVGTAFLPSYNQLFIYEGVNFYFAPVNKDAPLSRFRGSLINSLAKMVSIHIGLTQSLVKVENERYVPLIDNVGSLLVGIGIRVNRITRINAGTMFFFQKDINPLIDRNQLTSRFTTSLTFDLNVAKALGNLGRRLKLNQ